MNAIEITTGTLVSFHAREYGEDHPYEGTPVTLTGTVIRPVTFALDGCTCGGIGSSSAHRSYCAWSM